LGFGFASIDVVKYGHNVLGTVPLNVPRDAASQSLRILPPAFDISGFFERAATWLREVHSIIERLPICKIWREYSLLVLGISNIDRGTLVEQAGYKILA